MKQVMPRMLVSPMTGTQKKDSMMLMMPAVRIEKPKGGDADDVGFRAQLLSQIGWR